MSSVLHQTWAGGLSSFHQRMGLASSCSLLEIRELLTLVILTSDSCPEARDSSSPRSLLNALTVWVTVTGPILFHIEPKRKNLAGDFIPGWMHKNVHISFRGRNWLNHQDVAKSTKMHVVAFYPEKNKMPISSDGKHVALTLLVRGREQQSPGSQTVLWDPILLHFVRIAP